jgi:hypothetical protein
VPVGLKDGASHAQNLSCKCVTAEQGRRRQTERETERERAAEAPSRSKARPGRDRRRERNREKEWQHTQIQISTDMIASELKNQITRHHFLPLRLYLAVRKSLASGLQQGYSWLIDMHAKSQCSATGEQKQVWAKSRQLTSN